MSKVCDELRGDAVIAAQEAGFDNLREIIDGRPCGIEALISDMRETIFPSTEYELERLFCQHCSRRRRSWTFLTQMDPVIHRGDRHLSDILLGLSGMTREKRVEEKASINSESVFVKVADTLVIQHPRIHLREKSEAPESSKVNTAAMDNLERVLATQTPTSSRTTTTVTTRLNGRTLIEHTATRPSLEVTTAEKKF